MPGEAQSAAARGSVGIVEFDVSPAAAGAPRQEETSPISATRRAQLPGSSLAARPAPSKRGRRPENVSRVDGR